MPTNDFYNHTSGQPTQLSRGSSAAIRAEFSAIEAAFYEIGQRLAAVASSADFKLIYQGSADADPTARYDGTQLQNGDLYFNTVDKVMKSFADGGWYAMPSTTSVLLKSGGALTGPLSGTSASFSSTVAAAGFAGSGRNLTDFIALQITAALGYTPLNKEGDTMTGALAGTTATYSGSVTAADLILSSDERRKQKWEKLPDDVLEKFVKIAKIGTYYDKKLKKRKPGVGAQSLREVSDLFVDEDEKGELGARYGEAALVLLHKAVQKIERLEKRIAKLEKK